ncbi:hypothetical protein AB0H92_45340 [Streptomyces phaeochromogenes]|uniref:hypothetical protein n=1 Tax=Streptomyces phaeochromogenes TaxID=1923 RepID=UPI0033D0E9B9
MSLAAEAALLEGRLRLLQEAIDTVDTRIKAVSDTLRLLHRASSASDQGQSSENHCGSCGHEDADGLTDGTYWEAAKR